MNPHQDYYDAVTKMEQAGVDEDYIIGWESGYWLNPEREEQRVTEAYEAGYEKGKAKDPTGFEAWIKK
ncbi:Alvin_2107 family globule sulfur oxidation protein [Thiohalobacter sp.]|uniref:Alvin_2107 family globule sulfur oxidation protein n=1 Tax=Thiohalobacter sp. TaxID=2025948 RepID=UPI00263806E6|nr:hypothetical protein [Thiohalobacter sp.]